MTKRHVPFFVALSLLLLPSFFYVILNETGENHYALPVYFKKNFAKVGCETASSPYSVFSSPIAKTVGIVDTQQEVFLFHYLGTEEDHQKTSVQSLQKLLNTLKKSMSIRYHIYTITSERDTRTLPPAEKNNTILALKKKPMHALFSCLLFVDELIKMKENHKSWVIIADKKGRIRGFFNPEQDKGFRSGYAQLAILKTEERWE